MKKFNPKLYEILGRIPENATPAEIKKAFRTLAKIYHPDKKQDDPVYAKEMMSKLNEAYEILSNPMKRVAYDSELRSHSQQKQQRKESARRKENPRPTSNVNDNTTNGTGAMLGALVGVGLGILALGLLVDALFEDEPINNEPIKQTK